MSIENQTPSPASRVDRSQHRARTQGLRPVLSHPEGGGARGKPVDNPDCLQDKRVRQILENFLASERWNPEITAFSKRGVDIDARRNGERWVIRVKVAQCSGSEIVDFFVSVLGEALQRMNEQSCKYSIALPDTKPFRRLWQRLPSLAKTRTGITALFVSPTGVVIEES